MNRYYLIITISFLLGVAGILGCNDDKPQDIAPPTTVAKDSIKTRVPDEFIDLLFADQSIREIDKIAGARSIGNKSIWTDFLAATQLAFQSKNDEAIAAFHAIADNKNNEPRMRLWAWNGLRGLGVRPKQVEVLGLILEVPQHGSTEFLAMYADKKARYINYSGMVMVWEERQTRMDGLIKTAFTDAAHIVATQALTQGRSYTRTDKVRFSFLTTDGLMQAEKGIDELNDSKDDFAHVFASSAQMLGEMVSKLKKANKK